jgi:hypothetical protein
MLWPNFRCIMSNTFRAFVAADPELAGSLPPSYASGPTRDVPYTPFHLLPWQAQRAATIASTDALFGDTAHGPEHDLFGETTLRLGAAALESQSTQHDVVAPTRTMAALSLLTRATLDHLVGQSGVLQAYETFATEHGYPAPTEVARPRRAPAGRGQAHPQMAARMTPRQAPARVYRQPAPSLSGAGGRQQLAAGSTRSHRPDVFLQVKAPPTRRSRGKRDDGWLR